MVGGSQNYVALLLRTQEVEEEKLLEKGDRRKSIIKEEENWEPDCEERLYEDALETGRGRKKSGALGQKKRHSIFGKCPRARWDRKKYNTCLKKL